MDYGDRKETFSYGGNFFITNRVNKQIILQTKV